MKPIFSRQVDFEKNAFVNWRISRDSEIINMMNLAQGFLMSSIELANHCLTDNSDKRADLLIFPILTNANHGIELYLKALTWILNKQLKNNLKIEGSHNIKQIYKTVKSKVKIYGGLLSLQDFEDATKELWSYIIELSEKIESTEKDAKIDFSRYPFNNRYENHFYVDAIGNIEIDLQNFVSRFEIIRTNLNNLCDFLYHYEFNRNL